MGLWSRSAVTDPAVTSPRLPIDGLDHSGWRTVSPSPLARGLLRLDNGFDLVLTRTVGLRWDMPMSDQEQAPDSSGDELHGEADLLDDAREAALIRKVLRAQERHREGGVDPELDVDEELELKSETDKHA